MRNISLSVFHINSTLNTKNFTFHFPLSTLIKISLLTKQKTCAILKSANNPVEAEITAITPSQRARGAVNRAGNELSNGPPRAQRNIGALISISILRRMAHVSCQRYVCILKSAQLLGKYRLQSCIGTERQTSFISLFMERVEMPLL